MSLVHRYAERVSSMLIVVVLAYLGARHGKAVLHSVTQAVHRAQAWYELDHLASAARVQLLAGSELPPTVRRLIEGPDGSRAWHDRKRPPWCDPWGHEYLLEQRGSTFVLRCAGEDGRMWTADDLKVECRVALEAH